MQSYSDLAAFFFLLNSFFIESTLCSGTMLIYLLVYLYMSHLGLTFYSKFLPGKDNDHSVHT